MKAQKYVFSNWYVFVNTFATADAAENWLKKSIMRKWVDKIKLNI